MAFISHSLPILWQMLPTIMSTESPWRGILHLARDGLKTTRVTVNTFSGDWLEEIRLNIQCRNLPSIITGCIYRHPYSCNNTFEYLANPFQIICLKNKPVFILGDLNDNLLDSNAKLTQSIRNNKLTQLTDKSTRIAAPIDPLGRH